MSQKGQAPILILGGIVILIALASGIFYLGRVSAPKPENVITSSPQPSPTPDPTTNWKTYTNTKDHYSFKYPEEFLLTESAAMETRHAKGFPDEGTKSSTFLQYCPSKKLEDCAFPGGYFGVEIYENKQNWGIDVWLTFSLSSPVYDQFQKKKPCYLKDPRTKITKEVFSNKEATIYSFFIDNITAKGVCSGTPLEGGGEFKDVFIKNGQEIIVLSANFNSKEFVLPAQILSTFKFPSVEEPIANWKTYTNTNLGFQMRYPDNVEITDEDSNTILIKGNFSYGSNDFFLISKNLTDLSKYKKCTEILPDPVPQDLFPCYRETKDRYNTIRRVEKLGGAHVMDIETGYWGTDRSERIIRKVASPKIEILRGYGAGYDFEVEPLFAQILSTFRFLP